MGIHPIKVSKWSLAIGLTVLCAVTIYLLNNDYIKLGNKIDEDSEECYDNSCSKDYLTPALNSYNIINEHAIKVEREEKRRIAMVIVIAERKEVERLAKIEADRLAELERIRLAELATIEAEKVRVAKLEKERVRRLEEKKSQPVIASRGTGYKGTWTTFEASYYTSACYKCSGIGASGIDLRQSIYYQGMRVIAADPRVLPLWSIVEIQGSNGSYQAIVLDTGGKIKNTKVDVLVGSKDEAYKNGRHSVQLRVIRRGK